MSWTASRSTSPHPPAAGRCWHPGRTAGRRAIRASTAVWGRPRSTSPSRERVPASCVGSPDRWLEGERRSRWRASCTHSPRTHGGSSCASSIGSRRTGSRSSRCGERRRRGGTVRDRVPPLPHDGDPGRGGAANDPASRRLTTDDRALQSARRTLPGPSLTSASVVRSARPGSTPATRACLAGPTAGRVPGSSRRRRTSSQVWAVRRSVPPGLHGGHPRAHLGAGRASRSNCLPAERFASGVDVIRLEPGASWSGAWGIALRQGYR